ncbi:MAG: hypothetical protein ACYCW6_10470, partial [Candidatus Xenobia bacterium]
MEISPRLSVRVRSPFDQKATRGPEDVVRDVVSVDAPPPEPKPPQNWRQRLTRLGRNVMLGMVMGTGALGAIGAAHNFNALYVSASDPLQPVPTTPPAPVPPSAPPASTETARELFAQLQSNPQVQKMLQQRTDAVAAQVQQQLDHLPPFQQTMLLNVTAPLPTGDSHLLQIGPLPLPSLGMHALESQTIPLVVTASAQLAPLKADIRMQPEVLSQAPRGPAGAIYLGSFHTQVFSAAPSVAAHGEVKVQLDLDGQATQGELAQQQARLQQAAPGSPQAAALQANVRSLQARLEAGHEVAKRAQQNGFADEMQKVMADQGVQLDMRLPLSTRAPLVDGYHHLWLAPGNKVVITDQQSTPGLDRIQVPTPQ